jgi:ketopantoate reductase
VEAERPTEVEQITGRLVRLGERLLATTPLGHAVYKQVKELEASYLGADAAAHLAEAEMEWESEPF